MYNEHNTDNEHNTHIMSMAQELKAEKNKSGYTRKIYKAESDAHKGAMLSADIQDRLISLKESSNKSRVNLNDLQDVQQRTFLYLEACSHAEVFPSVMGLAAHGYNISRQALNQYLLSHPKAETTEFIQQTKDVMADVLTNASLYGSANPVAVIFQLKNHFDHYDRVDLAPVATEPVRDEIDVEEIKKRYAYFNYDKKESAE